NANEPISFTSKETSPQAGDWGTGVYFASDSVNSSLSYVDFAYGGYQPAWPLLAQPAVIVSGAKVNFVHCLFSNSQTRALDLINSDSVVQNSQFASSTSAAIYISGASTPSIAGNTLQNSGHVGTAIKIDSSARPGVQTNTITGFYYAVWLQSAYPSFSSNTLSDNSYNGVYVDDQTVINQSTTWQNSIVYLLESNFSQYPTVATSATLTIEAGAIIKPLNKYYTALKIEGNLLANGNSSSTLINFTSFKDDSLGGDSNNDGSLTNATSTAGDWKDIWLAAGSQSTLKFVRFQFGGFQSGTYGEWREAAKSLKEDGGAVVWKDNVTIN
ncbi:MAG TPA: hypothetical protein DHI91_01845, partial [Candidatus Portnoybacteria bacterium]|nr:hypothetical protein [Candidatus Portnoybacteria bacterium]